MIRKLALTTILVALLATPAFAQKQRSSGLDANGNLDELIARHAAANNVPEDLVRRVIKRESGGNPRVISQDNYGLMQIKLATARGVGYTGDAAGLLDANTNMTYAVKYLAGAYRIANGNADRAVHYYAAKNKGMAMPSTTRATDSFAPAAPDGGVKFTSERKLHATFARADGAASSSSLYSNKPDHH